MVNHPGRTKQRHDTLYRLFSRADEEILCRFVGQYYGVEAFDVAHRSAGEDAAFFKYGPDSWAYSVDGKITHFLIQMAPANETNAAAPWLFRRAGRARSGYWVCWGSASLGRFDCLEDAEAFAEDFFRRYGQVALIEAE
jgi:hypothetical protein